MSTDLLAALSLVLVEFDDGRIAIPIKGQTSTQLFPPLNAPVTWWGPAANPFFTFAAMVVPSNDYFIGSTRVISNPLGYPDEPNPDFQPSLCIDIQ